MESYAYEMEIFKHIILFPICSSKSLKTDYSIQGEMLYPLYFLLRNNPQIVFQVNKWGYPLQVKHLRQNGYHDVET